jgi:hypothetical protein
MNVPSLVGSLSANLKKASGTPAGAFSLLSPQLGISVRLSLGSALDPVDPVPFALAAPNRRGFSYLRGRCDPELKAAGAACPAAWLC